MGRSKRIRPKRLGEKLMKIRTDLGLTQEAIVVRLNYKESSLHPQNVSDFENGNKEPNLLVLLAYARLAGISTDVLIDDNVDLLD